MRTVLKNTSIPITEYSRTVVLVCWLGKVQVLINIIYSLTVTAVSSIAIPQQLVH